MVNFNDMDGRLWASSPSPYILGWCILDLFSAIFVDVILKISQPTPKKSQAIP